MEHTGPSNPISYTVPRVYTDMRRASRLIVMVNEQRPWSAASGARRTLAAEQAIARLQFAFEKRADLFRIPEFLGVLGFVPVAEQDLRLKQRVAQVNHGLPRLPARSASPDARPDWPRRYRSGEAGDGPAAPAKRRRQIPTSRKPARRKINVREYNASVKIAVTRPHRVIRRNNIAPLTRASFAKAAMAIRPSSTTNG